MTAATAKPVFRTEKKRIEVDVQIARFDLEYTEVEAAVRGVIRDRLDAAQLARLVGNQLEPRIIQGAMFEGYEVIVTLKPEAAK